jgi:hypothetical protein
MAIDGVSGLPVVYPLFWVCLLCQIAIPIGYAVIYRFVPLPFLCSSPRLTSVSLTCILLHYKSKGSLSKP